MKKQFKLSKRLGIGAAVVLAVAVCCAAVLGVADSERSEEDAAIQNAILEADAAQMALGDFVSPDGTTASLSEEELTALIEGYNARLDLCYAQENSVREYYKTLNEYYLREVCQTEVYYAVDYQVTDFSIKSITYGEDGDTAAVTYVITSGASWVEELEDGGLTVTAPVNRDTVTVTMVKEDGLWKLLKTEDIQKEMWPEEDGIFAPFAAVSEPNESEQIVGQTYSTFEEALAAAQSIDMKELDKF